MLSKKTHKIIWIVVSILTIISLIIFPIVALVQQSRQTAPTTQGR